VLYLKKRGRGKHGGDTQAVRVRASHLDIRDIIVATTNMRKINSWRRINVNPIPAMSVFLGRPPSRIEARLHRSVN
jgi:hypothetical protein